MTRQTEPMPPEAHAGFLCALTDALAYLNHYPDPSPPTYRAPAARLFPPMNYGAVTDLAERDGLVSDEYDDCREWNVRTPTEKGLELLAAIEAHGFDAVAGIADRYWRWCRARELQLEARNGFTQKAIMECERIARDFGFGGER